MVDPFFERGDPRGCQNEGKNDPSNLRHPSKLPDMRTLRLAAGALGLFALGLTACGGGAAGGGSGKGGAGAQGGGGEQRQPRHRRERR